MIRQRTRDVAVGASLLAVASLLCVPAAHRHSSPVNANHEHAPGHGVVHRHLAAHTPRQHDTSDATGIEETDTRVLWLDNASYVRSKTTRVLPALPLQLAGKARPERALTQCSPPALDVRSNHDPPRAVPGLRGPPRFLSL